MTVTANELTHTQPSIANSDTAVIAANAGRQYLRLQNDDGTLDVYIKFEVAAVLNEGIKLRPHGVVEFSPDKSNLDVRKVQGISSGAGPAVLLVTEG